MAVERYFLAAWQSVAGIGPGQLSRLVQAFGSAAVAWKAPLGALQAVHVLSAEAMEAFRVLRGQHPQLPDEIFSVCEKGNISLCTQDDVEYPDLLRNGFRPPLVLFYRGCLVPVEERLAMVGSRHCSPYGRAAARLLAEKISRAGVTVVSGAARGIDTESHQGAVAAGGRTIAVLGCGVDIAYPAENRRLLDEIAANGAVISEYMPGTPPLPGFFPARNRIIGGLCRGTLVVEAAERSGSLITAELSLDMGRDVFAVPGSVFSDTSRGCHRLIQQGAKLVTRVEDIFEEYGWTALPKQAVAGSAALSNEENRIYEVLSIEQPLAMDEIIYKLRGSNTAHIAFLLLQMELKGMIEETDTHSYVRAVKEDDL